jgi:type II secretory pathway predicted ATPase ExeA
MYYGFFGLSQPPFKITPDTDMFFDGGNRGAILEALIYAISQGEGIIKVTGEVGSGKTMLCRMLQTRLPNNVETVYLANPSVSRDEILHAIAFELQLTVPKDANRIEVMHRINDYLLERHAERKQVVLFVEESQSMPLSTLEEVRLLSNLETNHHKLLQIVLFGQPELDENLRLPEIRQLRERITHSFTLAPFAATDVGPYLTFRLRAAGYRGPDLFNGRVVDYISRVSEGLTRRVNIIADKALLAAFADGTHNVTLKHAKAAVRDTEFAGATATAGLPWGYIIPGVLIGCAIGVVALIAYQQFNQFLSGNRSVAVSSFNSQVGYAPALSEPVMARQQSDETATQQQSVPESAATSVDLASQQPEPADAALRESNDSSMPAADDLLEQRLRETSQWLAETDDERVTIQLLGTFDADLLRSDLRNLANLIDLERVFVYRTVAGSRPSFTVLFGTYVTRSDALRAIETLPGELRANGPYYRTINGIKAEIARNSG